MIDNLQEALDSPLETERVESGLPAYVLDEYIFDMSGQKQAVRFIKGNVYGKRVSSVFFGKKVGKTVVRKITNVSKIRAYLATVISVFEQAYDDPTIKMKNRRDGFVLNFPIDIWEKYGKIFERVFRYKYLKKFAWSSQYHFSVDEDMVGFYFWKRGKTFTSVFNNLENIQDDMETIVEIDDNQPTFIEKKSTVKTVHPAYKFKVPSYDDVPITTTDFSKKKTSSLATQIDDKGEIQLQVEVENIEDDLDVSEIESKEIHILAEKILENNSYLFDENVPVDKNLKERIKNKLTVYRYFGKYLKNPNTIELTPEEFRLCWQNSMQKVDKNVKVYNVHLQFECFLNEIHYIALANATEINEAFFVSRKKTNLSIDEAIEIFEKEILTSTSFSNSSTTFYLMKTNFSHLLFSKIFLGLKYPEYLHDFSVSAMRIMDASTSQESSDLILSLIRATPSSDLYRIESIFQRTPTKVADEFLKTWYEDSGSSSQVIAHKTIDDFSVNRDLGSFWNFVDDPKHLANDNYNYNVAYYATKRKASMQSVLAKIYKDSQEILNPTNSLKLKKTLYRGIRVPGKNKVTAYVPGTIESWSTSIIQARRFAGKIGWSNDRNILKSSVPLIGVFTTTEVLKQTSYWNDTISSYQKEKEWIVMGGIFANTPIYHTVDKSTVDIISEWIVLGEDKEENEEEITIITPDNPLFWEMMQDKTGMAFGNSLEEFLNLVSEKQNETS